MRLSSKRKLRIQADRRNATVRRIQRLRANPANDQRRLFQMLEQAIHWNDEIFSINMDVYGGEWIIQIDTLM